MYNEPLTTMGEMASTAGGVFARRSLPMIIGSIEGGIGRLQASDIPSNPLNVAEVAEKGLRKKYEARAHTGHRFSRVQVHDRS